MLAQGALVGAGPLQADKAVGRTWPDFLHEHAGAGVVLTLVIALLVMFLVGVVFVVVAYRRAAREGRAFDAFGGFLFKLGAPSPDLPRSSASPLQASTPPQSGQSGRMRTGGELAAGTPHPVARGALGIVRAAQAIAAAASDGEVSDREGYLLTALYESTKHHDGTTRRASILKLKILPRGDAAMIVHHGFPESTFVKPRAEFLRSDFETDGAGLCWAAVHACKAGHSSDSIKRNVFHAPDVSKESSFVRIPGHHSFKSVLIAPVHVCGQLMGAVCLDSEQTDHYEEDDQHLLALAALALGTAWQARAPVARSVAAT